MKSIKVHNPVVRGFNPDPCVIRVGDDYYLATSTFHYFPGVQIFHSKDLVNWKLICHPLDSTDLIDMKGNADSGGVWAPCISYHDGLFYLIYSDMKTDESSAYKDCHNYLITAKDIKGPWSKPVYLNSSGFDPSIFHEGDKHYILNVVRDHRQGHHWSYGIAMQEYSVTENKLIGKRQIIFNGSLVGKTEGPNLYKIGKYYYLVTAEGGTEYTHCTTVCRAENLFGPYELHPNVNGVILTAYGHPQNPMQKMGHSSFVLGKNNKWYLMHLMSRPLELDKKPILDIATIGHCPLGRESALQEIYFENDWPYVVGGITGREIFEIEGVIEVKQEDTWQGRDNFDGDSLNINYQSMRVPLTENMLSLNKDRKGYLRLYGYESLASAHNVSFIARRWQSFYFEAKTKLEFNPDSFQQQAGLVCMYDRANFTFIFVTYDEQKGRCINIMCRKAKVYSEPLEKLVAIPDDIKAVTFKVVCNKDTYQYAYSFDDENFTTIGPKFRSADLSDDFVQRNCPGRGYYTGAFVGIACVDMVSEHIPADFEYFEYLEKDGK